MPIQNKRDRRRRLTFGAVVGMIAFAAGIATNVGEAIAVILEWLTGPLYSRIPMWFLQWMEGRSSPVVFGLLAFAAGYKVSGGGITKNALDASFPPPPRFVRRDVVEQNHQEFLGISSPSSLIGRGVEIGSLLKFLDAPEPALWWTVFGPLGSGKTALAKHIILESSRRGWDSGFLDPANASPLSDWRPRKDTLVVVDDATEVGAAWDYLWALMNESPARKRKVRVLLFDRVSPTFPPSLENVKRDRLRRAKFASAKPLSSRGVFLGPLDDASARKFVRAALGYELSEHHFKEVYNAAGGNPLSLLVLSAGSRDRPLAEEFTARCEYAISRAEAISGPEGILVLAAAALAGPFPAAAAAKSFGRHLTRNKLADIFAVPRGSISAEIPQIEPELIGQELALTIVGAQLEANELSRKIFDLNEEVANARILRAWRRRPEAPLVYAAASGIEVPAILQVKVSSDQEAALAQRVDGLRALEVARESNRSKPSEENVRLKLQRMKELSASQDIASALDTYESVMTDVEGWPGDHDVARLRIKVLHHCLHVVLMAPLQDMEDAHVVFWVSFDGSRAPQNAAAEEILKYWQEYRPIDVLEEAVARLLLERRASKSSDDVQKEATIALSYALHVLGTYVNVVQGDRESQKYLALVHALYEEFDLLAEASSFSGPTPWIIAAARSNLIDIYVSSIQQHKLPENYWKEVYGIHNWMSELAERSVHRDDEAVLGVVAMAYANLVSHYGHTAASLAMEIDAEPDEVRSFLSRMSAALASLRSFAAEKDAKAFSDFSRQLGRALDSYIGVLVRNSPLGLSRSQIASALSEALEEIHGLRDESMSTDVELARSEASALEQALRWYSSSFHYASASPGEIAAATEQVDVHYSRLEEISWKPSFRDDHRIALDFSRALVSCVKHRGQLAVGAPDAALGQEHWERMSDWLNKLSYFIESARRIGDVEIASIAGNAAFQQSEACVFAARSEQSILGLEKVRAAASQARKLLDKIFEAHQDDRDLALTAALSYYNFFVSKTVPREESAAKILEIARHFPDPRIDLLLRNKELMRSNTRCT